jgi:hypothetical protein
MDPDTTVLLQSFGYDIGKGLITSAIVEWKKLKDDHTAQETANFFDDVNNSKAIAIRVQEKICQGFQQLRLNKQEVEMLLPLASDPLLTTELARQIVSDNPSNAFISRS